MQKPAQSIIQLDLIGNFIDNINQQQNIPFENSMEILTAKQDNKQNGNASLNKQLQRLKIQFNDKVFEINKLEEDFAEEKAKQFIEFQKERLMLNRSIKQLKEKLQVQNEQWEKKIEQIRTKSEEDQLAIKHQCQQRIKQAQIIITLQFQKQFSQQIITLKNMLETNEIKYKQSLSELQASQQEKMRSISQQKDVIMDKNQRQFKDTMEKLKLQSQKSIKMLKNIYIAQKDAKEDAISRLQEYIQSCVKEKIGFEHNILQINNKNKQLEIQITSLRRKITQMIEDAKNSKIMHEQQIKSANLTKMKDVQKVIDDFNKKCDIQSKRYESQIQNIQKQMKQISNIYRQKQKKWEQRGQLMLKSILNAQKKVDNTKVIKKLQFQLMKKEGLLQRQRQSLRNCKLQLQNMEDIYDKMFVNNNYLYKFRSKSYKVKKMRVPNLLNQSNSSIFVQERNQRMYTQGDKQN